MKRHMFEEMLQREFRWPNAGDMAFVSADQPLENADLSADGFTRLVVLMEGYRKAADLMVEKAEAERCERDYLVSPIIFNYRQFVELSLKYIIATYGPLIDVAPNWRTHDLVSLWQDFAKVLERFGTPDPDDADPVVSAIVAEFAKIDPGSYSHRYPVDTRGNAIPLAVTQLHLPTLADVMNGVAGYFSGCDGYLAELAGASPTEG